MKSIAECKTLVDCARYWEIAAAGRMCFTQPMGGGDANVKTWSWAEAIGEARRMAAYLKGIGLPEGSRIAICSKNCAYWLMADLAIWMAGHISVPIYPILTAELVRYTLTHSEASLLFVGKLDPVWQQMKNGVPAGLRTVAFPLAPQNDHESWTAIVRAHAPLEAIAACPRDATATIIYTSGSTGTPKGAEISFEAMHRGGKGLTAFLQSGPADRLFSYLPLAHAYERLVIQAHGLYAGAPVFFAESLDTFIHDLQRARPTLFASVPRLWVKFQQGVFQKIAPRKLDRLLAIPIVNRLVRKKILKQLGLDQVRVAASGSASIPVDVLQWYRRLGLELREAYGMTENLAYSHCSRAGRVRAGYVGNPYADVEQKISAEGEVLIKSPAMMKGYYKLPAENAHAFTTDGYLHTGDLGEIDDLGRLKITGRIKELFKTAKGEYVAPAPIENRLANHPLVEACYVTGSGCVQPYGVLMLSEAARETMSEGDGNALTARFEKLLEEVNQTLPAYEQLAFLVIAGDVWNTENGFLTPTLKIKRAVLEKTYGPMAQEWFSMQTPVVWWSSG
ncbi:AMP-binding acetyl-CoA synthetase [Desulfosarcina cetonica]|uniref:AMP-binding protein n=1 Tax=Desulfosarcina cetonica TaxID=90730 RepID=UPI0006D02179|nr:AMP-binding protein [Desulfosarcina cetonica]VTR70106.1 AMP-binding acetyl-CoA synthetase [Desulfosarcina cetonica]